MTLNVSPQVEATLFDLARQEGIEPAALVEKMLMTYRSERADEEEIASLRAHMAQARNRASHSEQATEADIKRSENVMNQLVEETERLGLYR